MSHLQDPFNTLTPLNIGHHTVQYYSLPALEKSGVGPITRLPVSIRILLEAVLRNCDGKKVTEDHVRQLANWKPNDKRVDEIPFIVARVVLQDFTGVPLLADLAAMRNVVQNLGKDPKKIEPLVPVDLVVDHSVMIDHFAHKDALQKNMQLEFERNTERYQFMKWGMQAFDTFKVVPPGVGIVHQVNLEYLARGIHQRKVANHVLAYPDTLVGTDSHTTMINGIGVVGWGVGGIEAEAGMLGQPIYCLTPDVVGVNLVGQLPEGVTATDLVLTITQMLRQEKVVGKFVEFFGEGACHLSVPDRATIANMAPEYGATMGFFPVDEHTITFMQKTGRNTSEVEAFEAYFKAQNLLRMPRLGEIDYSAVLTLDLSTVKPSLAGPKRPQDRIELSQMKQTFQALFSKPTSENGFGKPIAALTEQHQTATGQTIGHGDVLIAAITSCTNTSNPGVLLAAGLLAKKAVEKGLKQHPHVKTSLAPGSRVVTAYLEKTGLLPYLEALGFVVAAYGCTTCIGNSGDLSQDKNEAIIEHDLVCAAVLSGNRNFEARIHANLKANFLASPPLVVAYAIVGTMLKDLSTEPLGFDQEGYPVYLKEIWPTNEEVQALLPSALDAPTFQRLYQDLTKDQPLWNAISGSQGQVYNWPQSTYIAKPPFFENFTMQPSLPVDIMGAKALAVFGDSITTDHISPAGAIKESSPAGQWLLAHHVKKSDFNSYGSRRGNHEVMMRGTFANLRIKNMMLPLKEDGTREEGGFTIVQCGAQVGKKLSMWDAAVSYQQQNISTVIFGGEEYGTGSSRDWAAKGVQLQGVRAVIARSFERIHRSNLVGMGVLPLQFIGDDSTQTLKIRGTETFEILGLSSLRPQQDVIMTVIRQDGVRQSITLRCRIDTPIEIEYFLHGGILPFVLRELLA